MKVYDAPHIRNVGVVGHGGCGKTSLVSALLYDMGAVNRLGRVDDGTSITDFDPDEIERRISLQTALGWGEWRKTKINLLDTPAMPTSLGGQGRAAGGGRRPGGGGRGGRGSRSRPRRCGPTPADYGLPGSWW
jgi:hypothetical protein